MNIKPTSEQCQVWSSQAESFAINISSQGRHGGKGFAELFNTKFAELAAQWGASQAQQTTEPEAWSIPEWSKQDDLGGRVPSDVRVALNEAHRAGVRAGMARSRELQALQRGLEKVLADPEKHGLDLGGQK